MNRVLPGLYISWGAGKIRKTSIGNQPLASYNASHEATNPHVEER
jgi:hypothetical protein